MKKIIEQVKNHEWNKTELSLAFLVTFLLGIVIGLATSPKGIRYVGCNNGNYSSSNCTKSEEESYSEEE